jgi:hypothetical protein
MCDNPVQKRPMHCSPRCGAKTRKGTPCMNGAMPNGRCRMHGGKSTGRPVKHGRYTKAAKAKRKAIAAMIKRSREMV